MSCALLPPSTTAQCAWGSKIIEGQVCAGAVLSLPDSVIEATLQSTIASLAVGWPSLATWGQRASWHLGFGLLWWEEGSSKTYTAGKSTNTEGRSIRWAGKKERKRNIPSSLPDLDPCPGSAATLSFLSQVDHGQGLYCGTDYTGNNCLDLSREEKF